VASVYQLNEIQDALKIDCDQMARSATQAATKANGIAISAIRPPHPQQRTRKALTGRSDVGWGRAFRWVTRALKLPKIVSKKMKLFFLKIS
jgi:hypothetical protein